jgi:endonuclease/exonuclease/phosphatase family metal-dependent hydrolase
MEKINFLTWNLAKKKTDLLKQVLAEVVKENAIDVVVLQEASGRFINTALGTGYEELAYPQGKPGRGVRIFLRRRMFIYDFVRFTSLRKLVFVRLQLLTGSEELTLAAVHLHSKVGNTERQQQWKNRALLTKMEAWESEAGGQLNTVLVGDFNANPYEANLLDPYLLRGQASRKLIEQLRGFPLQASLSKKTLDFWYNPMWGLLGDRNAHTGAERPTGTFFRHVRDETGHWSLLDGFLVRPALMHRVVHEDLAIVERTASTEFVKPFILAADESLLTDDLSDHLPVKFSLLLN